MKQKFAILIFLIFTGGFLVTSWWKQAVKPANPTSDTNINFIITKGESIRNIADRLNKERLIRSPVAFFLYLRLTKTDNDIQAGEFKLNQTMDMINLIEKLKHGTRDITLTIPEGWRSEEIALRLAQTLGIPEQEFLKHSKEGYMFPDTYSLPQETIAYQISQLLQENFSKKVTPDLITKTNQKNLSLEELITIASLVEREAKFDTDRPIIASVILNRLNIGMKLDIDATVQYALGYQTKEKSWWKKELTLEDLQIDSPYNTYLNAGLPPTPICNPGLAVIKAVVEAPETDYLYYLADNTGKTHYSQTLEEHHANVEKYLR